MGILLKFNLNISRPRAKYECWLAHRNDGQLFLVLIGL